MMIVQHTIPINIVHDTAETIAIKKQFAKRQAFAALNTELADGTTYVLTTSGAWKANIPSLDEAGNPIVTGDGTYVYKITYHEWGPNNGATRATATGDTNTGLV